MYSLKICSSFSSINPDSTFNFVGRKGPGKKGLTSNRMAWNVKMKVKHEAMKDITTSRYVWNTQEQGLSIVVLGQAKLITCFSSPHSPPRNMPHYELLSGDTPSLIKRARRDRARARTITRTHANLQRC